MFKKLSVLLFCLSVIVFASAETFAVDGINYNVTSPTTVEVGNNQSYGGTTVSIPANVSNGGTTYSVTLIGDTAFQSCSGLTSVTIPNSVTSIGMYAFAGCFVLNSIVCEILTPLTINTNVFAFVNKGSCSLTVPSSSVTAYKTADVWKSFNSIIGDATLSTTESKIKNNVVLYPNPVHSEAVLELKNSENSNLEVYDINGKMVLRKSLNNNSKNPINTSNLPKGVYLFKVGKSVTKVIKS
ncbi:T9SS type A sorting domain-containing protein [Halpernia sp.]|uniref:T9SS type A sorting domain-containing protein n=1 Tax=Halpernia sp. TaxID=2782209 RepID=UPI003A95A01E